MLKILISLVFLMGTAQAKSDIFEITNPSELVTCLKNYIQNSIIPSGSRTSWEYAPNYSYSGKYAFATWNTNPGMQYRVMGINLSFTDLIHCDLENLADGTLDSSKPGFCRPSKVEGDVVFDYMTYVDNQQVETQKKLGFIKDSKIFCLNTPRS